MSVCHKGKRLIIKLSDGASTEDEIFTISRLQAAAILSAELESVGTPHSVLPVHHNSIKALHRLGLVEDAHWPTRLTVAGACVRMELGGDSYLPPWEDEPEQKSLHRDTDKEPVKILRGEDLWGEINAVTSVIAPDLITQMREMGFTEHVASTVAIEQILAMALDYLIDEVRVYRNEEGFEMDLGSGEVQVQLTEEPISPWTQAEDAVNAMDEDERAEFAIWLTDPEAYWRKLDGAED